MSGGSALAELGVYKGNSAKILHIVSPARKLYLFDTFEGFDNRDVSAETHQLPVNHGAFKDTSLEAVQAFLGGGENVDGGDTPTGGGDVAAAPPVPHPMSRRAA